MVKSLSERIYIPVLTVLHIMSTYRGAGLCTPDPIQLQLEFLESQLWTAKAPAVPENILQHYLLSSELYIPFSRDCVVPKSRTELKLSFT